MKSQIVRRYFTDNKKIEHDCFLTEITNEGTRNVKVSQDLCDDTILEEGDSISLGGQFINETIENNILTIEFVGTTGTPKILMEKKYTSFD